MAGETVRDEVEAARRTLGLTDDQLRLLPDDEGRQVFDAALAQFVRSGNRRWWWEDFRLPETSVRFADGSDYQLLSCIVPSPTERVWFIVEDDKKPFYPVYESDAATIEKVIGECYFFEYYVVAKDFRWLVCETHHNDMIAVGAQVQSRLLQCAASTQSESDKN